MPWAFCCAGDSSAKLDSWNGVTFKVGELLNKLLNRRAENDPTKQLSLICKR